MSMALYDRIGIGYPRYRSPDARIARQIVAALGESSKVLNVGAGTGSYEPSDRSVVAVDTSLQMLRQRDPGTGTMILGSADRLPFRTKSFDAALAVLTIHHWVDQRDGLAEMRRVARDRVVLLTWDPDHPGFWLVRDYFPEILEIDRRIFPSLAYIEELLGRTDVRTVAIAGDCSDGFLGAYWRRPEMYLDAGVRQAISTFSKLADVDSGLRRLRNDISNGTWERKYGELTALSELDIGYRIVVARLTVPRRERIVRRSRTYGA